LICGLGQAPKITLGRGGIVDNRSSVRQKNSQNPHLTS